MTVTNNLENSLNTNLILKYQENLNNNFIEVSSDHSSEKPPKDTISRGIKNAEKAWNEHKKAWDKHKKTSEDPSFFAEKSIAVSTKEILETKRESPLNLEFESFESQGRRLTMEDAKLIKETEKWGLFGIFDGHNGSKVSNFVRNRFAKDFENVLRDYKGDIYKTFEHIINTAHETAITNTHFRNQGTTAVLSFIDKENGVVYTATLGDSEAFLYRNTEGKTSVVPLSCVRDWSSKRDFARLVKFNGEEAIIRDYSPLIDRNSKEPTKQDREEAIKKIFEYLSSHPKIARSFGRKGVNVSRAVGDAYHIGTKEKPLVSHKFKWACHKVEEGDVLIIGCDGLFDFVDQEDIILSLNAKNRQIENLSKTLVNYAIGFKNSKDNVSVIAIKAT